MSRNDFNELLSESLESADFRRAFVALSKETGTRPVRSCRCLVFELPNTSKPEEFADITPGTVTAFVAREGESLLGKLIEAIQTNSSKGFNSVTTQIKRLGTDALSNASASATNGGRESRALPAFATISYAGKVLIGHLHVDEFLPVNVHPFVFNGGSLEKDRFAVTEYYAPGDETPLACVMVVRQPQLSNIEKEALRLVPSGSPNNVAVSLVAPLTPAVLQAVLVMTPYAAQWIKNQIVHWLFGTVAINALPDQVLESKAFTEMLKSLPPEASAAELLQLRTDILLRNAPR
jgi:hypothetical protein